MQSKIQSGKFMTISLVCLVYLISNLVQIMLFIDFLFKFLNSYKKALSNMDTKILSKNNYIVSGRHMIYENIKE